METTEPNLEKLFIWGLRNEFGVRLRNVTKDYNAYMSLDLSAFEGLWIAIFNGQVVASGANPKKVYGEAMGASKNKTVMLTKVPQRNVIELL